MATKENIDASDEIITVKCCVCTKKNITRDAEKYCVECKDYYCIPCTDSHKMFPAMSGHQILDKADFSSHGLQVAELPSYPTERCSTHKAKLLDMFCANHNEVVCASCVAIHHRACQEIRSIPEDNENLYRESSLRETKTIVNAMKKTMEDIKKSKEQLLRELKKHKNKATDSIRKFRKEMEAVLEKLEKESIKEVEAEYEKMKVYYTNKSRKQRNSM
ncbi:E3 ubiquitin/ISG15 ligase TRIM25-like isoform X2 [Mercenaria mercenaria]|uniref:E3 ubiquitin/ISG15 ligase TRIM25-like isoform X2 n=1 Tax=Mercenaria mercenaria TaxID=6596 RepID=UPI00234F8A0E|nr:E3 ubiquitin/ISG15 ligase TRIM25-like isoform X2 [Mercenaria mercenaria]